MTTPFAARLMIVAGLGLMLLALFAWVDNEPALDPRPPHADVEVRR